MYLIQNIVRRAIFTKHEKGTTRWYKRWYAGAYELRPAKIALPRVQYKLQALSSITLVGSELYLG